MSERKPKAIRRSNEMSYGEFLEVHARELSQMAFLRLSTPVGHGTLADAIRAPILPASLQALKREPVFRLLRAAKKENCPDAYNNVLYSLLSRIGLMPPEGVFVDTPGRHGRPTDPRTAMVYEKWIEIGKPPLGRQKLAHAIYGAEFTRADAAGRKRMVDRCGQAVKRQKARLLTA